MPRTAALGAFTRVVNASSRLDAVHNKLSVLRDAKESNGMVPIKGKDVGCEPHLELRSDGENSQFESTLSPHVEYFPTIQEIQTQMQLARRNAKRQVLIDTSPGRIPKHAKLET
ncbi:hypothetical protein PISMIDRAFT_20336 [Pisolithus microcarpus 441]|uniref:Uncharacterized protein n=1 Tax=Pisolithus microcarpus 441 TaxID=765257 RepID=A0A0C9YJI7_9AGAM|nr:hypothetical protein PISMIDRAFT_20336 [Pisolithus microcarpus 441]